MPDQSEAPIVRARAMLARHLRALNGSADAAEVERGGRDFGADIRALVEAAEIIRLCEEALEEVRKCGNGGARLTRTASDMVRRALAQIKGQNP